MSSYLVDRVRGLANIEVVTSAAISGLEGHDGMLEAVRWQLGATGQEVRRPIGTCSCLLVPTPILIG